MYRPDLGVSQLPVLVPQHAAVGAALLLQGRRRPVRPLLRRLQLQHWRSLALSAAPDYV